MYAHALDRKQYSQTQTHANKRTQMIAAIDAWPISACKRDCVLRIGSKTFRMYYSSTGASFIKKLQEFLEDDYEDFESLENASYVQGSELWESKFDGLLALVKEYIVDVWGIRKHKLYDSDSGSGLQLHTQSSPGERSGKFSQNGKFGQNGKFSQNGKFGQKWYAWSER